MLREDDGALAFAVCKCVRRNAGVPTAGGAADRGLE
jgi:hypothetical protein